MAIQATFTADFTKWDQALKNAQANLKTFEVSTKNVMSALQRMTSSFDGTKIMREAKTTAAAVEAIGGAARLTEQEQKRVNATVTEAIAKYKVLGQVAPKALTDLAEATKQVAKPTEAAAVSLDSLVKRYLTIGAAIGLAKEAFGALTDFVVSSVKSFASAEAAQNRMVAALRAQGTATPDVVRQYNTLASTIQRTTAFSDDAANEMEALFVQIGDVGPAQMEKASRAATDLAAGLGVDLRTATMLVAKAMEGNTGALGRYGVKIDETKVAAQGADAVFAAIADRFGGQAVAQLDTYAGKLDQLANNWDNIKEASGKFLVTNELTTLAMRELGDAISTASDKAEEAHVSVAQFYLLIGGDRAVIAPAIALLEDYAAGLNAVAAGARMVAQVKSPFASIVAGTSLPKITGGLEEFEKQNEAIDAATKKAKADAEAAAKAWKQWSESVTGVAKAMAASKLEANLKRLTAEGKLNADATQAIIEEYDKLRPSLDHLSEPLEKLRTDYQHVLESTRLFGGAMTELMTSIKDGDRMFKEGQTAVRQFGVHLEYLKSTSIDVAIAMQAVPQAITGISTAMKAFDPKSFTNRLKGALQDALTEMPRILTDILTGSLKGDAIGKAIGTVIGGAIGYAFGGPLGGAIGAAVGQGIAEMFSTKAEQTARRVAREFGANIGEEMGQAIVDRAKLMFQGNQAAAQIFSLPDIIQAAGGLNAFNIGPMFDRLHDVFTMIQTGAFSAAQGMEVLDKTFKQFADFVTDRGTLASKQLLDIIKLNEQYGTSSKAVAEFVTSQITGAFTGLTTFLDNAKVSSNEAASSISAAIFGAFEALQKQGASPLDAFNAIAPALEKLDAQLKATGLDGGAAFQTMMQYAGLAKDAVAGPLFTAIAGLNDVFHGLHNAGELNQEMFGGLAKQVSDTYNQLVLAGKGGQQALQLIAPTLQTLWEEMTDFGYVVDDATKALIDQGVQAGLVGDKQRSAQDKMLKAVERTAEAVEALAHLFGATLPSDIQKTTDAINKIPRDVKIGVQYSDSGFTPQPTAPTGGTGTRVMAHAAGGVFSQPHLAYVAEGGQPEMVGSVGFMTRALEGALARVQTSGGVTVIPVVINGSASADDVDAVLAALVRAEPRITGNAGGVRSALLRALGR